MNESNPFREIQSFLSIGYIYLVVMGILREALYFNQIGVEILKYSSIMDVLISPIAIITSSIFRMSMFFIVVFITVSLPKYVMNKKDENWVRKSIKIDFDSNPKEVESSLLYYFSYMLALGLFGFFVGTGIGQGWRTSKKIETEEIEYNDKLSFINGDVEEVEILGTNSAYIFYVTNESKTVKITPISGIVKSINENK